MTEGVVMKILDGAKSWLRTAFVAVRKNRCDLIFSSIRPD